MGLLYLLPLISTKLENHVFRELNELEILMQNGEQTGAIVQRNKWILAGSKWIIKMLPCLLFRTLSFTNLYSFICDFCVLISCSSGLSSLIH